jgi:tetratricopeptide (TPR) repeat protein
MRNKVYITKFIFFFLIIAIIFVPLYGCSNARDEYFEVNVSNGIKTFQQGSLKYSYGIPILTVSGTHYQVGLEYGVLLKDDLQRVYSQLGDIEKTILRNFPIYMKFFVKVLVFVKLFLIKSRLSKNYLDELRGVSDGSGVPFNQLLIASFVPELFTFSCTSFVKEVDGHLIHGRNLDYYFPLIGENPIVTRYLINGETPYTTIGCVGYLGAFTGMNDVGITITVNAAPTVNSNDGDGKPITFEVRDLFAHSKTLSDISKNLENYHSIKGWMLTIGSNSERKAVVYNIAETHLKSTYMEGDNIFVTNTFIDNNFAHKYMSLHEAGSESSVSRFEMAKQKIGDVHSVRSAIDFLSNNDFFDYKQVIGAGDVTLNNEGTLQSAVMDPQNGAIYFSSSSMYAGFSDFYKFDIKNNSLSLYKQKDGILSSDKFSKFVTWFRQAELLYLEGKFKAAYELTSKEKVEYLMQLEGLADVMEKLNLLDKADDSVLKASPLIINRYPKYALPYLIEAKVYFAKKDYKSAAKKSLSSEIIFPYQKVKSLSIIAQALFREGKTEIAQNYAEQCKKLILQYAVGKHEKRILAQINKILNY